MRFRPIYGVALVAGLLVTAWVAGQAGSSDYARVSPDASGKVTIPIGDLGPDQVHFYRFLNAGNQEIKFFVGRDAGGTVQVAFDANELCYKLKRGYAYQDGWMVCRKCDKAFELSRINDGGGGCSPVPLAHRVEGDRLVLAEADILQGWRYFR